MSDAPGDWIAMIPFVLVLGVRHGLDADHLVAIDGLTRLNAKTAPRLAKACGALFSLGHGLVVMVMAVVVGALVTAIALPQWLEDLGAWISIGCLITLGVLNLLALVRADPGAPVQVTGIKGRFSTVLGRASHPLLVAGVGSLFALSFDTLTQAVLFAATATQLGGVVPAVMLAAVFTAGMLLVDGFNGLWIYRLVVRTNQRAAIASRVFAAVVASLSFAVAAFGIAKYLSPEVGEWSGTRELATGVGVLVLVLLGFLVSMGIARLKAAD